MTPLRRRSDHTAPPKRRREDLLEELLEHGSRNFRRYRRRAYIAFAVLAVANIIAFKQIDDSRKDTVRRACLESNRRHDATIRQLDLLVAQIPDPQQRHRAERAKRGTIALIEGLAPRRDCDARADELVRNR